MSATLTCVGCGAPFEAAARVARSLAGSQGDPETPHLCWVCVRLHNSAICEVERDVKGIERAVAMAFR
jgi:hypothetical protein